MVIMSEFWSEWWSAGLGVEIRKRDEEDRDGRTDLLLGFVFSVSSTA